MENYTITKEQILKLANKAEQGCTSVIESDLKNWFPEAFNTEFKVGRVYKINKSIFHCTEITEGGVLYGYGLFDARWDERFNNNDGSYICACNEVAAKNKLVEASTQEWEAVLINEAKKRGFKNGVTILRGDWYSGFSAPKVTIEKEQHRTSGFEFRNDTLFLDGYIIFYSGNWAEIIPQEKTVVPMAKALKIIAKKMKVSPENIEIQY